MKYFRIICWLGPSLWPWVAMWVRTTRKAAFLNSADGSTWVSSHSR